MTAPTVLTPEDGDVDRPLGTRGPHPTLAGLAHAGGKGTMPHGVMRQSPRLFADGDLHAWLVHRELAANQAAGSHSRDVLLRAPVEELVAQLVDRFSVNLVEVDESNVQVQDAESRVRIQNYGREVNVPAMAYTVFLPFRGDAALLGLVGSHLSSTVPHGVVRGQEIVLEFEMHAPSAEAIRGRVERDLRSLREWLGGHVGAVTEFNAKLPGLIRQRIDARKAQLNLSSDALVATGFKIRARRDAPTFTPPAVRRKIAPPLNQQSPEETTLDDETYQAILKVIRSAMVAAERSPSVFKGMGEEDLRQIMVLFLNAVFEGEAMAEAFNFSGKTDILIRHRDANIFVAECKFWSGSKSLSEAITQLLSYTTWRDTKTAVIVLNRATAISTVQAAIPRVLSEHPRFVRSVSSTQDEFRAIFWRDGDPGARILTSVMLFDLPQ